MFGLGWAEILILGMCAFLMVAIAGGLVIGLLVMRKKNVDEDDDPEKRRRKREKEQADEEDRDRK